MNDDPNFESRLLLAFALAVLLFLVAMPFLTRRTAAPAPSLAKTTEPAAPSPQTPTPAPAPNQPAAAAAKSGPAAPKPKPEPAAPPVAATSASQFTVTTPDYTVVFSNRGADVRSWILKQYKDDNGKPLDLVDTQFASQFGYPLQFWSSDSGLRQQLGQALYQVTRTSAADGSQTVRFVWSDGSIQAQKTITFQRDYVADIQASVSRDGKPLASVGLAWPGAFGDRAVPGDFGTESYFEQATGKLQTTAGKSVSNGATHEGAFQFVGIEDQYFAAAFLPGEGESLTVTTLKNSYKPRLVDAQGVVETNKPVDTVGLAVAANPALQARLFVGPKKVELLQSVDPALRGLVDFGWFSFFAYPLFLWMNWTYIHWIHNYGWAILFLTFVITMATFPLKMKAQKSQAKMMALQPKINALNAKMKKYSMRDPRRQEVQQEVMKVYSEHGVNPLGGCLPMLIQLPLIYAWWKVLESAIELRHAPWIWWVHDLSARDPYYLLPLLLTVASFFSFRLMPMMPGQDPRQTKMMRWMMPLVSGWFFFFLPAGVNLYYLGYTVISAGQQWVANRTYNAAAVAAVAAKDAKSGSANSARKHVVEGKVVRPKG